MLTGFVVRVGLPAVSEHQDPRTLVPMDTPGIRRPVQKMGHVAIADEAYITGSAAAEISA